MAVEEFHRLYTHAYIARPRQCDTRLAALFTMMRYSFVSLGCIILSIEDEGKIFKRDSANMEVVHYSWLQGFYMCLAV